jgi:hypothetical protein
MDMRFEELPMPRITQGAAAVALCLALAPSATVAHTTIRSQATESVTEDNAIRIGHTCEALDGSHIPVIAQSVVFPSVTPEISTSDGSPVAGLAAVIEQGTIAGLPRAIQDRSVFRSQQVKRDALANMIGFSGTNGAMGVDALGRVPFQFTAPKFVATSCAKRLLVKVAVADVCLLGAGIADSVKTGKVNLWIPDNGSQYAVLGKAAGVDGIGSPATLTVNRNLTTNPLLPACGAGIDVTVTPSAEDVTTNLPIPGVWP